MADLNSNEINFLGDSIALSTNSAGDMSAMAVSVGLGRGVVDSVSSPGGSSLEVLILNVDTSVNNVHINTSAGGISVEVRVVDLESVLADSVQAPAGVVLSVAIHGVHLEVSLNADS